MNRISKHRRLRSRGSVPTRIPIQVACATGPLEVLNDHDVLVIADAQNLDLGARDLGYKVSWQRLGHLIDDHSRTSERHTFLSQPEGEECRASYFAHRGWTPHSKKSRLVRTVRGLERNSNTDHILAFFTGFLISQSAASLVLVCSGDGDLVEDIAEALSLLQARCRIATLSIAGSTARRLDARYSSLITANLELGHDCLRDRKSSPNTKELQHAS